ncbi:MAG TPA: hypothetical protein DCZ91_08190 [Lachnospiraceae bacterium]|nr:hypothetical protein [Lachnospiraceae bacterium]
MSDSRNWSATGEQMKNALTEALQSGDFKNLNDLVSQTVTDAVNEVGKHVSFINNGNPQNRQSNLGEPSSGPYNNQNQQTRNQQAQNQQTQQTWSQQAQNQQTQQTWSQQAQSSMPVWQQRARERELKKQQEWQALQQRQQEQSRRKNLPSIKMRRVGNVSNVLYQVFGGIGLGITSLVTLIRFFALFTGDTTFAGWIVNLVFLFGFYSMVRLGVGQKKRLKRAERYLQLCDYRVYGQIEHLAKGTGKSRSYVIRDLQKMLELGIFPEGHLDEQKTCFMLNDVVYRQYLEAENNRHLRELESRKALEDKKAEQPAGEQEQPAPEVSRAQESELHSMVDEGMEYIRKLRDLNDRIPGEVISAKLFCLENLLRDIFESVKQHPEQMDRMHKLMSYYLPTTLKLVESYERFDKVSAPGPDIIKAKAEIENTLDTINQAFRELLNNLFQDSVFDVTTDAQVLKTMLAKEGLTRDMDFAGFDGRP